MLGYLGYKAVRGQWRLYQQSRKAPGGPWTMAAVFFTILPLTVLWMLVSAVQRSGVFWVLLPVNAALLGLTLLSAGTVSRARYYRRIAQKYGGKKAVRGALNPQRLREHADFLDQLEAELSAVRGRERVPVPEALDEREQLTQSLLSVPCPVVTCRALATMTCNMGIALPVALVRKDPVTLCHFTRIHDAVASGAAVADDIVALFGNNVPRGLLP